MIQVCDQNENIHTFEEKEGWEVKRIKYRSHEIDYKAIKMVRLEKTTDSVKVIEQVEFFYPAYISVK